MPRNGSGTYSLVSGNPVVTGTTVSSTVQNNTMNDIAAALTGSLSSDGQTTVTGNIKMGSNKLTGLAAGTSAGDSVRYEQLYSVTLQTFTASGTYTPTAGTRYAIVEVQAPGGGSGAAAATTAGNWTVGGGGAAGGYAMKLIQNPTSQTVTINAAGTAGTAGGNGGTGGTVTYGAIITCNGGTGGTGQAAGAAVQVVPGVAGGTATGGDINAQGQSGGSSWASNAAGLGVGGAGGNSKFGMGGISTGGTSGVSANSGSGYGSGGGGVMQGSTSGSNAGQSGVAGQPGLVLVWEYA